MGRFTDRLTRKAKRPAATFTIPEPLLSMDWNPRGDYLRRFSMRQLAGNEVDWTEAMILRAIFKIGGRRCSGSDRLAWWRDIGPRARAGVRLCFHRVHQIDRPG